MKVQFYYSAEQWQKIQEIATANGCTAEAVFGRRLKPPCDGYDDIRVEEDKEAVCVESPPQIKKRGRKKK